MVKNTTGGTGTKSLARKHQSAGDGCHLRLPECELEIVACVTKMLGNGMCEVYTNNNIRLIGHIRNSFRGKNKRHNLISPPCIVMIGLHEWEKAPKNCNIMVVYSTNQVEQLRNIPTIKMDHLISLQMTGTFQSGKKVQTDFDFAEEEIPEIAPQQLPKNSIEFDLDMEEQVDIDDI